MNTYKTITQINSNPIYAPIGYEEEFKRRIFLDNFNRCMTIRTFQKTAGIEIKKKVNLTPTAKIIKDELELGKNLELRGKLLNQLQRVINGYPLDSMKMKSISKGQYSKEVVQYFDKLCTTKKGKYVDTRVERMRNIIEKYRRALGHIYSTYEYRQRNVEFLLRVGFKKYIESFDFTKKGCDSFSIEGWVYRNKNMLN